MAKILSIVVTVLLWAFYTEGQAASTRTKLVIGHVLLNARAVPLWVAKEQGFFSKYGLDAEVILVRGSPILAAAMSSGDIELGFTGGTAVMGAALGGADLKLLANFSSRLTQDLIVRPGIQTPQDLRGKRLGIVSIGGTTWMVAILGLEHLGLEPNRDKINLMPLGDQTVLAQAMLTGTIDATILDGVYSRRLQEKGSVILAEFGKSNIPLASVGVVARAALIEKKPLVLECHHEYWQSEEAMAEGSPLRAIERGERVNLPPVLCIQGTLDVVHPRSQLDQFVIQYRKAGGHITLELFEGQAEVFITRKQSSPAAVRAVKKIIEFFHTQLR